MKKERIAYLIKTSDDGSSSVREVVHCKDCSTGTLKKRSVISKVSKISKQYWLRHSRRLLWTYKTQTQTPLV